MELPSGRHLISRGHQRHHVSQTVRTNQTLRSFLICKLCIKWVWTPTRWDQCILTCHAEHWLVQCCWSAPVTILYVCILPAWEAGGCSCRRRHPLSRCWLQACCCSPTPAAEAAASAEPEGTAGDPPLTVSLPTHTHYHYCSHHHIFLSINHSLTLCFLMPILFIERAVTLNCATHLSGSPLQRGQSRTPMVPGSAVPRRRQL